MQGSKWSKMWNLFDKSIAIKIIHWNLQANILKSLAFWTGLSTSSFQIWSFLLSFCYSGLHIATRLIWLNHYFDILYLWGFPLFTQSILYFTALLKNFKCLWALKVQTSYPGTKSPQRSDFNQCKDRQVYSLIPEHIWNTSTPILLLEFLIPEDHSQNPIYSSNANLSFFGKPLQTIMVIPISNLSIKCLCGYLNNYDYFDCFKNYLMITKVT